MQQEAKNPDIRKPKSPRNWMLSKSGYIFKNLNCEKLS